MPGGGAPLPRGSRVTWIVTCLLLGFGSGSLAVTAAMALQAVMGAELPAPGCSTRVAVACAPPARLPRSQRIWLPLCRHWPWLALIETIMSASGEGRFSVRTTPVAGMELVLVTVSVMVRLAPWSTGFGVALAARARSGPAGAGGASWI